MDWSSVNSQVRESFHKWDCSLIESGQLFSELAELGFHINQTFVNLIENHKQIRNLQFSSFVKALKQDQGIPDNQTHDRPGPAVSAAKLMNAVIFRDIPVSSSAKAPFGTDNNMFIKPVVTGQQPKDLLTAEIIANVFPPERKRMGHVQGAVNVFKESSIDDAESVLSSDIHSDAPLPRHLKSSMNPITGEAFAFETDSAYEEEDLRSHCSIKRRGQETHGNIVAWQSDGPAIPAPIPNARRHYSAVRSSNPIQDVLLEKAAVSEDDMAYARNLSRDCLISHLPECQQRPDIHRRMTKVVPTKPRSHCPYATDRDDLESMRKLIRNRPLGSVFAPIPVDCTH